MFLFKMSEVKRKASASLGLKNASRELIYENSKELRSYDIFLSHSFRDAEVVYGIKKTIEEMNYTVYVDWIEDSQLDRENVTKETAELLRNRMKSSKSLFWAHSENAKKSKWMPWELGYFDSLKEKVAIVPILESEKATN